jgi:pyroglutamyl-peptidase
MVTMSGAIGLVTGSQPFAGLPTNPAELVLPFIDGMVVDGITIVARATPVSRNGLPSHLPALVEEFRPAFVLALGLALGAPIVRAETIAVNACHFAIPDNEGVRPLGGEPILKDGPPARIATWDAGAIVEAILDEGIPARTSFHAGTHLCNLTLYTYLGAIEALGLKSPCGFLHLPYLPEQVVWLMREGGNAPASARSASPELPSMAIETQIRALKATLAALARQAHAAGAVRPASQNHPKTEETLP